MRTSVPRAEKSASAGLSLTRRALLARSVQVVGALAVVPAALAAPRAARAEGAPLQALSPAELSILDAVADAFVPQGGAFAVGARDVDLARRMDAFAAAQGPDVVQGLRGALWLVELGAGPLAGHFGRFSRLSAEVREDCLGALVASRLALAREVFAGLKQLTLFTFYSVDASWPATGYEGPWVHRGAGPA